MRCSPEQAKSIKAAMPECLELHKRLVTAPTKRADTSYGPSGCYQGTNLDASEEYMNKHIYLQGVPPVEHLSEFNPTYYVEGYKPLYTALVNAYGRFVKTFWSNRLVTSVGEALKAKRVQETPTEYGERLKMAFGEYGEAFGSLRELGAVDVQTARLLQITGDSVMRLMGYYNRRA